MKLQKLFRAGVMPASLALFGFGLCAFAQQHPKPLPPFPVAHEVTVRPGAAPSIVFSAKVGTEPHTYHVGDTVNGYVIAAINEKTVTLKWGNQKYEKRIADLEEKAPPPASTQTAQGAGNGPGAQISSIERACVSGDTSPAGTVVDGYRKKISLTPMGKSCAWVKDDQ